MSKSANELNNTILIDKIFGFRAFGLILYGILSSIFFLIGVPLVEKFHIGKNAQFFIIILIIIFIFSLIRYRLKDFYLTTDFLDYRSIMITTIMISISTAIFGLSGVLQGEYVFVIPHNWNESMDLLSGPNFEPVFLAVISLSMGSTLFLTGVTKGRDLVALPPSNFINSIIEVRKCMKILKNDQIWNEYVSMEDDKLIGLANKIEELLNQAIAIKISFNLQNSLKPVHRDMMNFIHILENVKHNANEDLKKQTWEMYFANIISHPPEENIRLERMNEFCKSINRIKGLELDD